MSLQTDQSLTCPSCGVTIKLTESLAAPLVAATRAEYEQKLKSQAEAIVAEKRTVAAQQAENERRAAELEYAAKQQEREIAQIVQERLEKQLSKDRQAIREQESARGFRKRFRSGIP